MDTYQKNTRKILVNINSKEELLKENTTIFELLEEKNIKKRAAIWLNGKQLLQSEYSVVIIKSGDNIKILKLVAGG